MRERERERGSTEAFPLRFLCRKNSDRKEEKKGDARKEKKK